MLCTCVVRLKLLHIPVIRSVYGMVTNVHPGIACISQDVNGYFRPGVLTALVGESGAGKVLRCTLPPTPNPMSLYVIRGTEGLSKPGP